jgi:hypothetical protein
VWWPFRPPALAGGGRGRGVALLLALVAATAFPLSPALADWTTETRVSGLKVAATAATARFGEQAFAADVSIECYPGEDGSFTIMLVVEGIEALSGFPYLDFEGPDAPMNERALFRVAVGAGPPRDLRQSGWFATGTDFAFAHSDIPAGEGIVAGIVRSVLAGGAPWTIAIVHPDDPAKAIVAEVPLEGALPALAAATEGCR